MQKKIQVMIPIWMMDYFEKLGGYIELNTSELFRLYTCVAIIASVTNLFPDYKAGITLNEIFEKIKVVIDKDEDREEIFRFLSDIYFEARKAAEYRLKKIK